MREAFFSYYSMFFHPFKGHHFLKSKRKSGKDYCGEHEPVTSWGLWNGLSPLPENSFMEIMALSWIFVIIKAIYTVLTISIGFSLYEYWGAGGGVEDFPFSINSVTYNKQSLSLFFILLEVVFAPLSLLIMTRIWAMFIKFFALLYESECEDLETALSQIVNNSLSSYLCLVIPIIGGVAQFFSFQVLIFAGLKKNLNFSTQQSLLVLASPYLLGVLFLLFLGIIMSLSVMTVFMS